MNPAAHEIDFDKLVTDIVLQVPVTHWKIDLIERRRKMRIPPREGVRANEREPERRLLCIGPVREPGIPCLVVERLHLHLEIGKRLGLVRIHGLQSYAQRRPLKDKRTDLEAKAAVRYGSSGGNRAPQESFHGLLVIGGGAARNVIGWNLQRLQIAGLKFTQAGRVLAFEGRKLLS